jgi:hypothetical protein
MDRSRPPRARGGRGRGRARPPAEDRVGAACVILLDKREGEPDLTGTTAVFEGYFDPETGDRRRPGDGVPRLRAGTERLWGYECWWRFDPAGAGATPEDHEAIEAAKKLLRGLLRDARRAGRVRAT